MDNNYYVEVGKWDDNVKEQWKINSTIIGNSNYYWVRFWPKNKYYIIEKIINERELVGYYIDICTPFLKENEHLTSRDLFLDIWISPDFTYIILDEDEFKTSRYSGEISGREADIAVEVVDSLCMSIQFRKFPNEFITGYNVA